MKNCELEAGAREEDWDAPIESEKEKEEVDPEAEIDMMKSPEKKITRVFGYQESNKKVEEKALIPRKNF